VDPTGIDVSAPEAADQLVFTLLAATGDILKVEKVSAAGERSAVPLDDALDLARKGNLEDIEAALDDAFEAGIISMLDSKQDPKVLEELAEDQPLRGILQALIIGSAVRRRLQRRLAGRLLLGEVESRRPRS
jgi:hypothetical protein